MSRLVSRAESWERVYEAFENVNFAAFDFNTIKQSILDYVKLYFPESFNDFIETSEFIAIVESFAYIAEQVAYRLDVNAHENFISTAQRRDSILRLAKLISYTASRPIPARGLAKLTSVATTESIVDANGRDLGGVTVRWNDITNANWKDQFILIMNRVLEQDFGTVGPNDRFQVQDVLFELYDIGLVPLTNGVFKYSASVNGGSTPMELVSVAYDASQGIIERRPANNSNFTLLYASDGLGDASETTGFLTFTKQGTLQRFRTTFDGVTPNQTYDVTSTNVNDIDVWLNNVDPSTGETLDLPSPISFRPSWVGKSGEWVQVDLAHSQNVIFNTNPNRNKYEVETRDESAIRLIFGDGEFADIPQGTFDIWARTSVDEDIVVPQATVVNTTSSFSYVDALGRTQTFTFSFTLIGSLQNASAAETLDHIRATAPSVYYTQDRMVNAEDYNVFMLQDPSILKLRAINRTFAGDSKYVPWHDGSESYENVKMFGDDGVLYYQQSSVAVVTPVLSVDALIANFIEPLLSSTDLLTQLIANGVPPSQIRTFFTTDEKNRIAAALTPPPSPVEALLYFNTVTFEWYAVKATAIVTTDGTAPLFIDGLGDVYNTDYAITAVTTGVGGTWTIVGNHTQVFFTGADFVVVGNAGLGVDGAYVVVSSMFSAGNTVITVASIPVTATVSGNLNLTGGYPEQFITTALITVEQNDVLEESYTVTRQALRLVFESQETQFWNTNDANAIIDYDTLTSNLDTITALKANVNYARDSVLSQNWTYDVLGQETIESGPESGLPDIHRLSILPSDINNDGLPDNMDPNAASLESVADIINYKVEVDLTGVTFPYTVTFPIYYIVSGALVTTPDVTVSGGTGVVFYQSDGEPIPSPAAANDISNAITFTAGTGVVEIIVNDYVYFTRTTINDPWFPAETTYESINSFITDQIATTTLWKRHPGRDVLNFAWFHFSPRYHLVDPAPTNIIDMSIITKGYFTQLKTFLEDPLAPAPDTPTPLDLRTAYGYLLNNKMISDSVVLLPGRFKLLFGARAPAELQAVFRIIRSQNGLLTDNQVKTTTVSVIRNFFDVTLWEFGETFFFTELAAAIHAALPTEISSVVLVPTFTANQFGDMFQVLTREDEVLYPDITVNQIEIVTGYTSTNLRLNS